MHLIVYTSDYTGADSDLHDDVGAILRNAHINNAAADITGVFFHCGRRFLQFIEGAEDDIHGLMRRIKSDRRHTNIEILIDESVSERAFPAWSMDYSELESSVDIDSDQLRKIIAAYRQNLQSVSELASVVRSIIRDGTLAS